MPDNKRFHGRSACVFVGVIYAIWTFVGTGVEPFVWGMALLAIGWPIRLISRWLNGSNRPAAASPAAPVE